MVLHEDPFWKNTRRVDDCPGTEITHCHGLKLAYLMGWISYRDFHQAREESTSGSARAHLDYSH